MWSAQEWLRCPNIALWFPRPGGLALSLSRETRRNIQTKDCFEQQVS